MKNSRDGNSETLNLSNFHGKHAPKPPVWMASVGALVFLPVRTRAPSKSNAAFVIKGKGLDLGAEPSRIKLC